MYIRHSCGRSFTCEKLITPRIRGARKGCLSLPLLEWEKEKVSFSCSMVLGSGIPPITLGMPRFLYFPIRGRSREVNAKFVRGLFVLAIVMVSLVAGLMPASAHHPIVSGSAVCNSDGNWEVTWVVKNGNWEDRSMTLNSVSRSVPGISAGMVVAPNGSVSGTETLPGTTSGTDSLVINASWDKGGPQNVTGSDEVTLPEGGCKPPVDKGYTVELKLTCEPPVYEVVVKGPNVVSVDGELKGTLGDEPKTVRFTVHFSDESSTEDTVSIPAKGECGEPPVVEPPQTEEQQPDGSLLICQWAFPENGGQYWVFWDVGNGQFQNVLNSVNYPNPGAYGPKFGDAKAENSQWIVEFFGRGERLIDGNFTLWMEGLTLPFHVVSGSPVFPRESVGWDLTGRCQNPAPVAAAAETPCQDCPPAQCLLVPGTYVASNGAWVGLFDDGTVTVFATKAEAEDAGLTFAGTECGLCAVHTVNAAEGTVFVGPGSNAYDIAVAIQLVEKVPGVPHFTNSQFAAAQRVIREYQAADYVAGWYSYR